MTLHPEAKPFEVDRVYRPDDVAIRRLLRVLLGHDERPVSTGRVAELKEADRVHYPTANVRS